MSRGHERSDAQPRYAVIGLGVLGAGVLATLALAAGLLVLFAGRSPPVAPPHRQPPAPRLEVVGGADLARVRSTGARRLSTYGWADRGAGLARIPIDRAMQLTAQRGWADAEPAP